MPGHAPRLVGGLWSVGACLLGGGGTYSYLSVHDPLRVVTVLYGRSEFYPGGPEKVQVVLV